MSEPILSRDERARTVRELQHALRTLSLAEQTIPPVPADGVYGADTARAVRIFQRENGLEETGRADFATWNALLRRAEQIARSRAPAAPLPVFRPPDRVIREGDAGDPVLCVQMMLRRIRPCLSGRAEIWLGARYGKAEAGLVGQVQSAAGLTPTGQVDKETWNALTALYGRFSGKEEGE